MITFRFAVFLMSIGLFAQTAVEPRIPNETLPAGGGIQIKLELTSPNPIIVGHFEMDSFSFDSFDGVSVFSSSGDAYGVAYRQGSRFIANLVSPQGSLGTQPDYPFFVVAANIPSGLAVGTRIPLSIGSGTTLTSPSGTPYSIPAPKSGVLTIGGTVSITNVIPGGGLLPPGTEVRLLGTGFDAETRVDVNEVVIENLRVLSPTEIRFNVSQAVQMTAKRIHVRDRRGSEAVYYSYLRAIPMGSSARPLLAAAYPVFSSSTYTSAVLESGAQQPSGFIGVAISNSTVSPVQVSLALVSAAGSTLGQATVALPGGSRWSRTLEEAFNAAGVAGSYVRLTSGMPVHVLGLRGDEATGNVTPFAPGSAPPPPPVVQISTAPGSLQFSVPRNGQAPLTRNVQVTSTGTPLSVSAAATASWITVSPTSGVTPLQLNLSVNPAGLPAGSHSGTVNLTAANGATASIPVTLVIEASPGAVALVAAPPSLSFSYETGASLPNARNVQVSSGGTPLIVSAASSAAWLNASPVSGSTPLQLSVSVSPAGLAAGNYSAAVSLTSPGATTISVPVSLTITSPPPGQWNVTPATLRFQSTGNEQRTTQSVNVRATTPGAPFSVVVEGSWLSVTPLSGQSPADLLVTANSAGLSPGSYPGAITIRPSAGVPITVPASLTVTAPPVPQLLLSSSSFEFIYTSGGPVPELPPVQVTSSGTALPIQVTSTAPWIEAVADRAETPATIRTRLALSGVAPGTHTGSVIVAPALGTPRSINIAVQVLTGTQAPPTITSIMSGASQTQSRGLAPGEIISIYGASLAGSTRVNATSNGRFEALVDGVSVWIGSTPAPILYLSPRQINVQVPFEQASNGTVGVSVEYQGIRSAVRDVAITPVSATIFTVDASGRGQAAVLNQDYALNTGSSPARRGSAIMIFATGGGATVPSSNTGSIANSNPNRTIASTFVWIGGQRVPALYSGTSPGSLTGLLQINAIVPGGIAAGTRVALAIEVDGVMSQDGVTIAVE